MPKMRMKNLNAIKTTLRRGALFKQQRPHMHGLMMIMMHMVADLKSAMTNFLLHRGRPDSLYSYGLIHLIALEDHWRSADGEPRDDDQLDDSYCILKLGGTNFSIS